MAEKISMPLRRSHSVTQKNEVFFLVDANSQRSTALFTRPRPEIASCPGFVRVCLRENRRPNSMHQRLGTFRTIPGEVSGRRFILKRSSRRSIESIDYDTNPKFKIDDAKLDDCSFRSFSYQLTLHFDDPEAQLRARSIIPWRL